MSVDFDDDRILVEYIHRVSACGHILAKVTNYKLISCDNRHERSGVHKTALIVDRRRRAHIRSGHGDGRRGAAQGLQVLPAVGGLQE